MGQFDTHRYQKAPVRFYFCPDAQKAQFEPRLVNGKFQGIEGGAVGHTPQAARVAPRLGSIDPTSAQYTLKQEFSAENRIDRLAYQGRTPSP
jgi:hypothetical protein